MDADPPLSLSGERLRAVYRVEGDLAEARARAERLCVEQTVEISDDLVEDPAVRADIVGQLVELEAGGEGACLATVAFAVEAAGSELPQLLNLLFGNSSLVPGIRLERLDLPPSLLARFGGPRFGRAGLRRLVGGEGRPLAATALKPLGLGPRALATQASAAARGGLDVVKDDHGLADQPFSPFEERVLRCAAAVADENARAGRRCLYAPNVTAPADRLLDRARRARELGAGAVVVSAGLVGLDAVRMVAEDDETGLPVLMHPALLGSFTAERRSGISHFALYGQIARLAGADGCIFPHHGGRFSFTDGDCRSIAEGSGAAMGGLAPSFPVPAGGVGRLRIDELCDAYGGELVVLIGGDLRRSPGGLEGGARELARAVRAWAERKGQVR